MKTFHNDTSRRLILFSSLFLIILTVFSSKILESQATLYPDSDGDGITDKLELFAGLNPNEDECQPRKCRGISVQGSIDGEHLILLMGQNSTMKEKAFDDITKMESVKGVFKEYIQFSPSYIRIGLYTYGKNGCSSFEEMQSPFKQSSKSILFRDIESLQPSGNNSVVAGLERLKDELKDKKGKFNILVVMDSMDTCGGNLSAMLKSFESLNTFRTGIKFFLVGIGFPTNKIQELERVALETNSKFIPVSSHYELKKIFDPPFREVINSLRGMVCLQVELDDLIRCESNKINQLRRLSVRKLMNPINKDFSPEEKDYFLQQIPVVEHNSKIKLETYDLYKKDISNTYQKRIIEISKIITLDRDYQRSP